MSETLFFALRQRADNVVRHDCILPWPVDANYPQGPTYYDFDRAFPGRVENPPSLDIIQVSLTPVADKVEVWPLYAAPAHLRALCPEPPEAEGWLAFVPEPMAQDYIPWLEEGRLGAHVSRHAVPGGYAHIALS